MSWKTLKHPSSRRIKKAFFVLRASFFQDQAPTALGSTIHQFKIKPRRPLKKAFFVLRSSFFQDQAPTALEESTIVHHLFIQDQAPTALWINKRRQIHTSNRSSRLSPKALEDLFITVSSRSSPKALEDPLKSTFKDQAHGPLKKLPTVHPRSSLDSPWINETPILKIKPQRLLEDPLKSTFKDQAHGEHSSKIKPQRPLDQSHIHKYTPYGDRIRGSNLREIEFSVFTNWHAQWDHLCLSSLSPKFKRTSKINGIKEGSNCSRNWRKEQERPRRKWCHFGHHDSKHGKSYFCHLFHLCINSAKGTRVPQARAYDHPSLTKGTKGGKTKGILRIHALR
ncbi:hypothetical protein ACFX15_036633 [Malus domestica]